MKNLIKFCGILNIGNKGYIYTLVTIIIGILLLSLVSFYFEFYQKETINAENKISTESLYYLIESIKKDIDRANVISGERAAVYAINYITNSSKNLSAYSMRNCTKFNYTFSGPEAAIAELMLCGTLNGNSIGYINDNTLLNWTRRINKTEISDINIKNITISPYDSWNFAVITTVEISANKSGIGFYNANMSVLSIIPITGMPDPLYYLRTNEPDLIQYFKKCNQPNSVNGTIINNWLASRCYHSSNLSYNGSSFFDRMEGNLNLSEKYVNQSKFYFNRTDIGLESFADLYNIWYHNIPVDAAANLTWIDYFYWQNSIGICCVNWTINYSKRIPSINLTFRIDELRVQKYNITEADCSGNCNVLLI